MTARRGIVGTIVLVGGVGLLLVLRLLVGRHITPAGGIEIVFGVPESSVLAIRTGAAVAAIAAGSALALSGLAFQVLLRNPLASPWVLGVSSGAGFGLMLAAWLVVAGGGGAWLGNLLMSGAGLPAAGRDGYLGTRPLPRWHARRCVAPLWNLRSTALSLGLLWEAGLCKTRPG